MRVALIGAVILGAAAGAWYVWDSRAETEEIFSVTLLDQRRLHVTYSGGSCEDHRSVEAKETVRLTVTSRSFASSCDDEAHLRFAEVTLDEPLGERQVVRTDCTPGARDDCSLLVTDSSMGGPLDGERFPPRPRAEWVVDDERLSILTYGSSSCAAQYEPLTVAERDRVVTRLKDNPATCTADISPSQSELAVPAGAPGRPLVVLVNDDGGFGSTYVLR